MTVTIDATNLVLIDVADSDTGWTSSIGGLNTTNSAAREGGTALQDQASEETYQVFHTITEEDFTARTIFGWQKSGNPSVEADPAGLSMYLGDDVTEVSNVALNAAGTGYAATNVLTVALGSGVLMAGGASATITVDTVGGSGEILTFTLTTNGQYITDPTPLTANVVTGGAGTGATFDLTINDQKNQVAYAVGGVDNFGFFFQGWSLFRLNTADLPTNSRNVNGLAADMHITGITEVGYGGEFPTKASGNSDNIGFDVLRYCANTNPALLIEGGTTGARGTWAEVVTEDENSNNAWGIVRELVPESKAYELNFGVHVGENGTADSFFDDSDFQLFINGAIPDAGANISAGSMNIDFIGNSTATTNLINFDNFLFQGIGIASNWDASNTDIDELKWTNGQLVDLGTLVFQVQDAGNKSLSDIVFSNCGAVTPSSMDMDRITFNGTTDADGAFVVDENQDTTKRTQSVMVFNSDGTGHAVNVNPTGSGPFTFDFDNWTYDGYGADDTTDAEVFINPNTLSADITINIINGGDTPTVREVGSYTGTLTIVNAVTVKLTVQDVNLVAIENARVLMEAAAGGDLPAEESVTITRVTTTATVAHTAHGLSNGDKVHIEDADQEEYNGVKTITNVSTNAYDYTVSGSPTTPATGTITSTAVILDGLTNVSGILQDTAFNFTNTQPVTGKVRKSSTSPFYRTGGIVGSIVAGTGFDSIVQLVLDE